MKASRCISFVTVPGGQKKVPITFDYNAESDSGTYPSLLAPERGRLAKQRRPARAGDRSGQLHSLRNLVEVSPGGWELARWVPAQSSTWNRMHSGPTDGPQPTRPDCPFPWPGALRPSRPPGRSPTPFASPYRKPASYIWPVRHRASDLTGANCPPMGQRFSLESRRRYFEIFSTGAGDPAASQEIRDDSGGQRLLLVPLRCSGCSMGQRAAPDYATARLRL
jgi:hypothetical protein